MAEVFSTAAKSEIVFVPKGLPIDTKIPPKMNETKSAYKILNHLKHIIRRILHIPKIAYVCSIYARESFPSTQ